VVFKNDKVAGITLTAEKTLRTAAAAHRNRSL
jgi:hypothetical protein